MFSATPALKRMLQVSVSWRPGSRIHLRQLELPMLATSCKPRVRAE